MKTGRYLSELRGSNAAGLHGKTSADRYNTERRAIEEDIMSSTLEDLEGPSLADLDAIENDDEFWNSLVEDPEDYEPGDREIEYDEDDYGVDPYDSRYDR